MTGNWSEINKEHVVMATEKYDKVGVEAYSRNTFLVYNN